MSKTYILLLEAVAQAANAWWANDHSDDVETLALDLDLHATLTDLKAYRDSMEAAHA